LATLAWALASMRLKSDAVSKHATGGAKVRLFCFTICCRNRRHPFAPITITPACALMLPQQHNACFFLQMNSTAHHCGCLRSQVKRAMAHSSFKLLEMADATRRRNTRTARFIAVAI